MSLRLRNTEFDARLPPHYRGAEVALLGGIMRDPETFDDVLQVLDASDFYFDAHGKIFAAIAELVSANKPVDLVALSEQLQHNNHLADIGGNVYLAELFDAAQTGANVRYHAGLVRDTSLLRKLIHASNEIARDARDHTAPADELVAQAAQRIFDLVDSGRDSKEPTHASVLARDALERIDRRAAGEGGGLSTGFVDLDKYLDGLKDGELIAVGGRPGEGKSALATAIALHTCKTGNPVLFFSLEMYQGQIADRILSMRSRVPLKLIGRGKVNDHLASEVTSAAHAWGREPFYLLDRPGITSSRLASETRRAVRRWGVKLVVVDYLQLMRPENPKDNRYLQVGLMATRMKELAMACGIPIMLLAQLNRESEARDGGRPKLSDFRESGNIEQDADVALLLHREKEKGTDKFTDKTDVIVAKNRNGPTGIVSLFYRSTCVNFESTGQER